MKLSRTTVNTRTLLFIAVIVVLNLLVGRAYFRLDFTADQRYTLTKSTKEIVKNLSQPVTVTAYISENLPPQLDRTARDFRDLLVEYRSASNDNLVYEFIDPTEDEEKKQEAIQAQVFPRQIQSREKDKVEVQEGFIGAVIRMGTNQASIPALVDQRGQALNLEYALTSNILKVDTTQKTSIAVLTGHGESGLNRLRQAQELLSVQHSLDTLRFSTDPNAFNKYRTLVSLGANQPFTEDELERLDAFLESGGRLFVGVEAVNASLDARRPWTKGNTGLEEWINDKGVQINQNFLIDIQAVEIGVQTVIGTFGGQPIYGTQNVPFPYFPRVRNFQDHPISQGLEEVFFQFPSPIEILGTEKEISISPLVKSSTNSGSQAPPQFFNQEKQWTRADFPFGPQTIGVAMEGKLAGNTETRMVVFSDGDFPQGDQQQPAIPDNVNLFANAIDWLEGNTALAAIRTKEVESRPIEKFLTKEEAGSRTAFKWINFLLPIVIVVGFGLLRRQRRSAERKRWREVDYS